MHGGTGRSTTWRRWDDRAANEIVAIILLIGLVFAVASVVVLIGSSAIGGLESQNEQESAERSLESAQSDLASVQTGDSTDVRLSSGVSEGTVVDPDDGNISVELNGTAYGPFDIGSIVYQNAQSDVAYQGGGVWRYDDGQTVMLSPPDLSTSVDSDGDEATFRFDIPELSGEQMRTDGFAVNTLGVSEDADSLPTELGPGEHNITINSTYADGWERHLADQDGIDPVDDPSEEGGELGAVWRTDQTVTLQIELEAPEEPEETESEPEESESEPETETERIDAAIDLRPSEDEVSFGNVGTLILDSYDSAEGPYDSENSATNAFVRAGKDLHFARGGGGNSVFENINVITSANVTDGPHDIDVEKVDSVDEPVPTTEIIDQEDPNQGAEIDETTIDSLSDGGAFHTTGNLEIADETLALEEDTSLYVDGDLMIRESTITVIEALDIYVDGELVLNEATIETGEDGKTTHTPLDVSVFTAEDIVVESTDRGNSGNNDNSNSGNSGNNNPGNSGNGDGPHEVSDPNSALTGVLHGTESTIDLIDHLELFGTLTVGDVDSGGDSRPFEDGLTIHYDEQLDGGTVTEIELEPEEGEESEESEGGEESEEGETEELTVYFDTTVTEIEAQNE